MRPSFTLVAILLCACAIVGCSQSESSQQLAEPMTTPAAEATDQTAASQAADAQPSTAPSEAGQSTTAQSTTEQTVTADDPTEEVKPPSEQERIAEVRQLYSSGKFDEAEAAFAAVREAFPDSLRVKEQHAVAASYLMRDDRKQDAFAHWKIYTDDSLTRYLSHGREYAPPLADQFGQRLGTLAGLADDLEGPPTAEDIFDEYAAQTADSPNIVNAQRAAHWAEAGRLNEARALVEQPLAAAQQQLVKEPEDQIAVLRVADALQDCLRVESAADHGDAAAARDKILDFLFVEGQAHPTMAEIRQRFLSEHMMGAGMLAYSDPEAAAAILERVDEFEQSAIEPLNDEELTKTWREERNSRGMFDRVVKTIEESRKRFALIGTPAEFPDNADGWVGVEAPLTSDMLHGKVVLLDFFAVWCGPCVSTFPHLRAWHDEFAADGFQIIGVSNYQSYDWDPTTNKPVRVDKLEPAAEQLGMEKFAEHHELPYAIAFMPDRELQSHYIVSGIPHVVLIDRSGKVRLHRIGSGKESASDMEQAIKECLAEDAPAQAAPTENTESASTANSDPEA